MTQCGKAIEDTRLTRWGWWSFAARGRWRERPLGSPWWGWGRWWASFPAWWGWGRGRALSPTWRGWRRRRAFDPTSQGWGLRSGSVPCCCGFSRLFCCLWLHHWLMWRLVLLQQDVGGWLQPKLYWQLLHHQLLTALKPRFLMASRMHCEQHSSRQSNCLCQTCI